MKFVPVEEIFRDPTTRRGLPAWTYNNDELTQLEMEQIFLRNWMFVAHVSDLPRAGDYQCFEMANERAVVVRDQDGQIRAFHNVCRHRASRVVAEEKGHCGNAMICPFHGWSYNLDGSLKNVPKANALPDFDREQLSRFLAVTGRALALADDAGVRNWHLSLTHSVTTAGAYVLAER